MKQLTESFQPVCEGAYGYKALEVAAKAGVRTSTTGLPELTAKLDDIRAELAPLANPVTENHQEERDDLIYYARHWKRTVPGELAAHHEVSRDPAAWLVQLSDPELLAFLRWNEQSLRPLQADLDRKVTELQPRLMEDISWMAAKGHVPASLPNQMQQIIAGMRKPIVFDIFDAAMGQHTAYYTADTNQTGFSERLLTSTDHDALYKVQLHEYFHAAGRSAVFNAGTAEQPYHLAVARWAYEANIEHLAQTAINGEFELVIPGDRTCQTASSYERNREMYGLMLEQAAGYVTIEDTSHACFMPARQGRFALNALFTKMDTILEPVLNRQRSIQSIDEAHKNATLYREEREITAEWLDHVLRHTTDYLLDEIPGANAIVQVSSLPLH